MTYLATNNAFSTLAGSLSSIATTLTVATGHGDRFPVVSGGDYTYISLEDAAGNEEIVKVTARATTSDVMTIVRAQDNTIARNWAAGDIVELRIIAKLLNDAIAHVDDATAAHAATAIAFTPAGSISATTVQAAISELDSEVYTEISALSSSTTTALTNHLNDTSDAHDASAISYAGGTGMSATDVEAAIDELATEKANLSGGTFTGALNFARGTFTGALNLARGTVAMHATTMDLWALANTIDGTGSAVTITAIVNAPQAGARRTLYPIAGTVITNGATFAVDGAANYTALTGDSLEFEAITTSTYKVHITSGSNLKASLKTYFDTLYPILSATTVTASGTSVDFVSIPAGVKRVTIKIAGISTNNTGPLYLYIGDSGGIETTGYLCSTWSTAAGTGANSTTAFQLTGVLAATTILHGILVLELLDAATNTWAESGTIGYSSVASIQLSAGSKSLSAPLDRIGFRTNSVDTFDAGTVNISWEL